MSLFRQIHEIVYHGRGYDYMTVYNMPVWLRNTTYKFISDSINAENEANNKALNKGSNKTALDWVNPDRSKLQ